MKKEADRINTEFTVFEGMTSFNSVICAMENAEQGNDRRIIDVYLDKAKREKKTREFDFVRRMSEKHGFAVHFADSEHISEMSVGTSHGGVIFHCTDRSIPSLSSEGISPSGFYVMLEGIEDPYNFGYAIRSLYASGVDGVILSPRNWMSASGVVCRSSAGTSEAVSMFVSDAEEAVGIFRSRGYKIVCAGIRDSVSSFDADLTRPIFLIVGGERRGISAKILALCDTVVRLDYGREFRGSLSAASAASILGYEVLRQNRSK